MNAFDIGILVAAGLAGLGGWRMGFLARLFSWVGLAAGLYLAVRFLPNIVTLLHVSGSVPRITVAILALLVGAFVGQGVGLMVGGRLHSVLPFGGVRSIDRAVGGLVGVFGVLVAVWLLAPSMAAVPGTLSQLTTGSVIARNVLNSASSLGIQPPNTLEVIRRLVGQDGFPQVFTKFGRSPYSGNPPVADPLAPAILQRAEASTVKVQGQACQRLQEGSGWTAGPNLVVTNAHVVAGEAPGHTQVLLPGQLLPKPADVVLYNPDVDLALLYVPNLGERPLPISSGTSGQRGVVLGHPNGQDSLAVQPAAIADPVVALGEDLYNTKPTKRQIYVLAARLTYGDSGAPLVDTQGRVIGIAFAIAPDRATTAYALSTAELKPLLAAPHTKAVSTQGCVSG
ncbi:MAG TPA: MarP family serine protease [Acidimicrobiales bacterium]|nr:MarP family serine protease [Acidimicrobiales bacterium]